MSANTNISSSHTAKETKQLLLALPDKNFKKTNTQNKMENTMEIPNQISAIAEIIKQDWKKPYFGAIPYLDAMYRLDNIGQMYGQDSAANIVLYFLSNAGSWRGQTARAIKNKLNQMLKDQTI